MPKRMIGMFYGEVVPARILDMRQGLPPLPRLEIDHGYAVVTGNAMALSPDQSYAVLGLDTTSAGNMQVYSDPANLGGRTVPVVTFGGGVKAVAASNDYYAFAGYSPFLYVFKRSDGALQTVSTTGLGTVNAVEFSPDGTKMAVGHSTSPYLRVYNVADWSYVNAATAPGNTLRGVCFSHDGTKLVVCSDGSPYISMFDVATMARTYTNTNAAYGASISGACARRAVRSPIDTKTVIFSVGTSPWLAKFDTATTTPSLFTAPSPNIGATASVWVDPDPDEDAVYVNHQIGSLNPSRTISRFKISTGTLDAANPASLFRNILFGNMSTHTAAVILMTTPYRITGTVRDVSNLPVARKIRAFRRSNGELVAETMSNASTGEYVLKVYDPGPFDVQFLDESGELLNDLFYAKTEPQAV